MGNTFSITILSLGLFIVIHAHLSFKRRAKSCPLPPSPAPHRPFIGLSQEMMDDSLGKPWQKFDRWRASLPQAQECGMLHIPTIRQCNIVVSRASIAQELLEKRGANYSGRLPAPFIADMVNHDMILANSNNPKKSALSLSLFVFANGLNLMSV